MSSWFACATCAWRKASISAPACDSDDDDGDYSSSSITYAANATTKEADTQSLLESVNNIETRGRMACTPTTV